MQNYPSVTEFMATKLVTFTPDTDIRDAMRVLLKKKISGAPVLNDKRELVGMLSEVDCLKLLVNGPYDEAPAKKGLVGDFMTTNLHTISSDRTILDAAYEFVHSGMKRLPICEDGKLVGQISRVDILRAMDKIGPKIWHVPASWKGREPVTPDHKKTRHTGNA
jgi:predicted transcriptional regulator